MEFTIQSIWLRQYPHYTDEYTAFVKVTIDAKEWTKLRNKGDLGWLYGVLISNAVHHIHPAIVAYCPTVADKDRASKGIKTIELSYKVDLSKLGFKPAWDENYIQLYPAIRRSTEELKQLLTLKMGDA